MFTRVHEQNGIRVTFRSVTNGSVLRQQLYAISMRESYPIADHVSAYADKLIEERARKSDVLDKFNRDDPALRNQLDKAEDRTIPPSERAKFEAAQLINRSINQLSGLLSLVADWSGMPFPLPDAQDRIAVKAVLDWYMADDPDVLDMIGQWADVCNALNAPLSPVHERPVDVMSEAEKTDPLSVAAGLVSQDG